MGKRDIASIALKLMGIYIFIKQFAHIPMFLQQLIVGVGHLGDGGLDYFMTMVTGFISSLLYIVGCILLVIYSDKVAAKLFADERLEFSTTLEKDELMAIAFSCIGVMIIANGMASVSGTLFRHIMILRAAATTNAAISERYIYSYFTGIIQLMIGFWLFLGSQGIINIWHKMRGR